MKKLLLTSAIVAAAGMSMGMSTSANASALASDSLLTISPGVPGGYYNYILSGSYFAMDGNGDGIFQKSERVGFNQPATPVTAPNGLQQDINGNVVGGITLNQGQMLFGNDGATSPTNTDGTPNPNFTPRTQGDISNGWEFFGAHGWNIHPGAFAVTNGAGNTATIDMTGWTVHWNGGNIDMGQGGNATVTCGSLNCAFGDTYSLTYGAVVPSGSFTGVAYQLDLVGTIKQAPPAVPVPAAVWLFGSGLLGLVGVARRRKAA